jgi:hypothetical protein
MNNNRSNLPSILLQAGCIPSTPVDEALSKVSKKYGYPSQEFQSFLSFVRTNAPDSLPAKYAIKGHTSYDWQAGIDWLAAAIDWRNIIPGRYTSLASLRQ